MANRVKKEIGLDVFDMSYVPDLRSHNQGAIDWATCDQCPSTRAKNIDVQMHFVRQIFNDKDMGMTYVPSADNDGDILTKPLSKVQHDQIFKRIALSTRLKRSVDMWSL